MSYRTILERQSGPVGEQRPSTVKLIAIDAWLRGLSRLNAGIDSLVSPKTKGHIMSLMHRLWERAMLWDLLRFGRNPLQLSRCEG